MPTPRTKAELEEAIASLQSDSKAHRQHGRTEAADALDERIEEMEAQLEGAPEMTVPDLDTDDALAIAAQLRRVYLARDNLTAELEALNTILAERLSGVEQWAEERLELVAEEETINNRIREEQEAEEARLAAEASRIAAEQAAIAAASDQQARRDRIEAARDEFRNEVITREDVLDRFPDDVPAIVEILGEPEAIDALVEAEPEPAPEAPEPAPAPVEEPVVPTDIPDGFPAVDPVVSDTLPPSEPTVGDESLTVGEGQPPTDGVLTLDPNEGEDTGELPVVEAPVEVIAPVEESTETEAPAPPLESEQTLEGDGATAGDDGTDLSSDASVSEPASEDDEPGAEPALP